MSLKEVPGKVASEYLIPRARRLVERYCPWSLTNLAKRPKGDIRASEFKRWVAARMRLAIRGLMMTRSETYERGLNTFESDSGGEPLKIRPLTRADFLAALFADFTYQLDTPDNYCSFSTIEFWDAMGPEGATPYSAATLKASTKTHVTRAMLIRPGSRRLRELLKSDDRSAVEFRNRLREHEDHSQMCRLYTFRYAIAENDDDYYKVRARCHLGRFEFKFGDKPHYLTMQPEWFGHADDASRTRLKNLSIEVPLQSDHIPREVSDVGGMARTNATLRLVDRELRLVDHYSDIPLKESHYDSGLVID